MATKEPTTRRGRLSAMIRAVNKWPVGVVVRVPETGYRFIIDRTDKDGGEWWEHLYGIRKISGSREEYWKYRDRSTLEEWFSSLVVVGSSAA